MKHKLKDLGEITTGKTPSKGMIGAYGRAINFLTPRDLKGQRYSIFTERGLSLKGVKYLKKYEVMSPSISVSCIGSDMGKVIFNKQTIITNQQLNSISNIRKDIDPLYLYYLLLNNRNLFKFMGSGRGSTMPILSKREFGNLEFEFPSLKIQKLISYRLDSLDKKIEVNRRINDNLLELMDSRFNHFISNSKLTDATLSDITDIHSGGNKPKEFSKVKTNKFCIPVYSNGVSNNGLYGFTNKAKVNERSVSISARGTIGFTVLHNEPFVPIVRLIYLTSKSVPINFLYLFVRSMNIQGYGSTQQQITVPYLKGLKIKVPDISEINKFDANNISAFDLILENKKENILLSDIKETLLNKYF
ncbi:restriction endonuclease subunit S [Bombilactobacillus mellis]|uniref:restriction endonuclease subunit S n=1 Tax=Bombilactobacillus mellis TaxID=1218508 RepID=UPI001580592D|nr:restriction endonuclease subunit S [Bombilactobacillus mellis]NUF26422.1 hypothetical protein [Bombilactobacillus mellis]